MRILLSNDDGFEANGLRCLKRALEADGKHELWVVAPDRERSATSMALSIWSDLRLRRVAERSYTVDGFPADCVNLALHVPEEFPAFDLVVSGVNHGPNLGDDVHYSGTVAAARQAALHDVLAIAVSSPVRDELKKTADLERPARWVANWIDRHAADLSKGIVYNVNYPQESADVAIDADFPAERYTYQGRRTYHDRYQTRSVRHDEWIVSLLESEMGHRREDHSDFEAILEGRVSITPLSTYTTHITELRRWFHRTLSASTES
ncbi:MAG: 5'/3'-nucleotidase SurE [Spirochaetales bacterium]|nr:5'/3'-nucleotidase SurE [Leptospiraceae bacterium]MCP5483697.1 5'/3'-nucleotidase SurE [Spirochaetales bacterium]